MPRLRKLTLRELEEAQVTVRKEAQGGKRSCAAMRHTLEAGGSASSCSTRSDERTLRAYELRIETSPEETTDSTRPTGGGSTWRSCRNAPPTRRLSSTR